MPVMPHAKRAGTRCTGPPRRCGDVSEDAVCERQPRHYDGYHAHQLDEDVERRTGRILEGVAHRIAHDRGLVRIGTLAAHVALFHVLVGAVPWTARVAMT